MKKKKKLIVIGVVVVALGFFFYLSRNIEGRYRIGVWLGCVTDDTSLHEASGLGQKDKVERLVASGLDVNAKNRWGQTPLYISSYNNNKDVVEILITNGADVNAKCKSQWMQRWWWKRRSWIPRELGWTSQYAAIDRESISVEELLLANGADVNTTSHWLPKSWTFYTGEEDNGLGVWLSTHVTSNSVASVGPIPIAPAEQLIFKGPDIETEYKWLINSLWVAKHTGNVEIVELLKEYQAIELSLHQAATEGNIEQVRLHISDEADLNAKYRNRTPLSYARDNGHTEIVELLREHGAVE